MNLLNAPEQGILYALYPDRVEYRSYKRSELSEEKLQEHLLELHLFDERIEYRIVHSTLGDVETVISDEHVSYDDLYIEKIFTLEEKAETLGEDPCCMEVVNYLKYDENDLLLVQNYRLKEVKNV